MNRGFMLRTTFDLSMPVPGAIAHSASGKDSDNVPLPEKNPNHPLTAWTILSLG